ncbi:TolC family protein [Pseudoflavitalea sp. G-6-1-2]|uniref:TolC family protein n=1 Tax=Pseudoflavitalea sp. G-6-1-2 TaxID=2728841 RepID=UPI00146C68B9|nr:TolC family protein [Pseudoflavitalea sp. G-6-1-2]NML19792.1 TolC family protein [Pseudoflavitalea sp. G-6-1-2]
MKKIIGGLALIIALSPAMAQDSPVRDEQLRSLIHAAVNNYPRIKEMEEQLKADGVKESIIKAGYLPTVTGNLSYRFDAPVPKAEFPLPTGPASIQFAPNNNYNANVSVQQLIYDFGRTKLALNKNNAEHSLNIENLDNSKNAIAYQVAQIYYNIQFNQKAIQVQQDQISSLKENERLIQARIKNGDALEYDLLTTQVRTANATNRLTDLQSQLEKQFVLLQWLTAMDAHGKIPARENYDDLTLLLESGDWKSINPEARTIQKKLEVFDYDLKESSVNSRPSLTGSAAGGVRNGFQPDIDQFRLNTSVGVGLSIPILSGDRPKLRQKLTQVQIDAAKLSLNTLENNIKKDLATVQEDYRNLQTKLKTTSVLVSQAERAYTLAQVRFKEGLITNVELLTAQTNVEDAKLQLVQLQYQTQLDKLESHKVVGTKLFN